MVLVLQVRQDTQEVRNSSRAAARIHVRTVPAQVTSSVLQRSMEALRKLTLQHHTQ